MDEALAGGTPIFEWMHRHPNGKMVPAEVRLVCLPGQDKNLLRASIIDTTERKRREKAQQAIYDISEAIHTTEDLNSLSADSLHSQRIDAGRKFLHCAGRRE